MKGLKEQWVEVCKTAERQQKEYFEMMKTDSGLRTAYHNALDTIFKQ
jgi:hypothetical protein